MRALVVIAAVVLTGCSLERGTSSFAPQTFADVGVADVGSTDAAFGAGSGAGTMTGTWLQVHEASTCVLVEEQVTWATYLVDIEQAERTLTETRRQCEITLSPVFGLRVFVPDVVLPLIEFVPVDTGYVSNLLESGTYSSPTELALWGLQLDDPIHDPVPDDPDDPAVVDADEDGNPGVTFGVIGSQCERYIAQRSVVRYTGTFTTPNQVDGTSVNVTDSNVLGSSQALCGVNPRLTANDRDSRFRMVRIDGAGESIDLDANGDGEITCDEVRPYFEAVLERRETNPENCD